MVQLLRTHLAVVLLIFTSVAFLLAGLSEVFQASEAREGSVIWQLLSGGNWILPLRNGDIIPSKPPLFHWCGAVLFTLFGFGSEFTELFLRLPSLVAGVLLLLVVHSYAAKQSGKLAGTIGVAILSSSYGFARLALDGRVDMLFAFFTTWAILVALEIVEEGSLQRQHLIKLTLLISLATLTKGPLGICLPLAILVISWGVFYGVKELTKLVRFEFAVVFFIPAIWYFFAFLQGGEPFIARQLVFENLTRFFGGDGISGRPFYFYLPHLIGQGFPWSLLFLLYLFFIIKSGARSLKQSRFIPTESRKAILLNLLAFGIIFTILSLSAGKRRSYLLLLLPQIAIILSLRLSATVERLKREGRLQLIAARFHYETLTWGTLLWFIGILPGLLTLFIGASEAKTMEAVIPGAQSLLSAVERITVTNSLIYWPLFSLLAISSISLWLVGHRLKRLTILSYGLFLLLQLLLVFYPQVWLAVKAELRSYKQFANRVTSLLPEDIPLRAIREPEDESLDAMLFYLRREVSIQENVSSSGFYLGRKEVFGGINSSRNKELLTSRNQNISSEIVLVLIRQ